MSHWTDVIAGFDTETTGPDPDRDRIVTASIVLLNKDGEVTEQHDWLIAPDIPITEGATAVHGVTNERAAEEGLPPVQALKGISDCLAGLSARGTPVAAFNGAFDFTILACESRRYLPATILPNLILDPHVLDKQFWKYRSGKRTLTATCATYGVALDDAHEASADATAAARLAQLIVRNNDHMLNPATAMRQQASWRDSQARSLEAYFQKTDPNAVVKRGWPVYTSIN